MLSPWANTAPDVGPLGRRRASNRRTDWKSACQPHTLSCLHIRRVSIAWPLGVLTTCNTLAIPAVRLALLGSFATMLAILWIIILLVPCLLLCHLWPPSPRRRLYFSDCCRRAPPAPRAAICLFSRYHRTLNHASVGVARGRRLAAIVRPRGRCGPHIRAPAPRRRCASSSTF